MTVWRFISVTPNLLRMYLNTTGTDPGTNYIDTRNRCDQMPGIETDIRNLVIINNDLVIQGWLEQRKNTAIYLAELSNWKVDTQFRGERHLSCQRKMEHNNSIFTSHNLRCDLEWEAAKATHRMTLGHPIYSQEPSRKLPHIHALLRKWDTIMIKNRSISMQSTNSVSLFKTTIRKNFMQL